MATSQVLAHLHKSLLTWHLRNCSLAQVLALAYFHTFTSTNVLLHLCLYLHTYASAQVLSHSCTCAFVHLRKYMNTWAVLAHFRTCSLAQVLAHLCTCTLAYMRTHTPTQIFALLLTCALAQVRTCTLPPFQTAMFVNGINFNSSTEIV